MRLCLDPYQQSASAGTQSACELYRGADSHPACEWSNNKV